MKTQINNKIRAKKQKSSIISSAVYLQYISHMKNKQQINEELVYQSLRSLQKQLGMIKMQYILLELLYRKQQIKNTFMNINYSTVQMQGQKDYYANTRQLVQIINNRNEQQQNNQYNFICTIRQQFYEQKNLQIQGIMKINKIMNNNRNLQILRSFFNIKSHLYRNNSQNYNKSNGQNYTINKIVLQNFITLSQKKVNQQTIQFYHIFNNKVSNLSQQQAYHIKFKAKMLMKLRQYPINKLKRTLYRWFINTTSTGHKLMQKTVNKLVLYTNINKPTALYRLLGTVRHQKRYVHPRMKSLPKILYLYLTIHLDRIQRNALDNIYNIYSIKHNDAINNEKHNIIYRILQNSKKRRTYILKIWRNIVKKQNLKQTIKSQIQTESMNKLIKISHKKIKSGFILWKSKVNKMNNHDNIRTRYLSKIITNKTKILFSAFQSIKQLPKNRKMNTNKIVKFKEGLEKYIRSCLSKGYQQYRQYLVKGRQIKSKVAIQLVNKMCVNHKIMYQRWQDITHRTKIMNQIIGLSNIFQKINFVIKSIFDCAISNICPYTIFKERAINQIYKNAHQNIDSCFTRWRELNNTQKCRENRLKQCITIFDNLIMNARNNKIREIATKFRENKWIIDIYNNYLKKVQRSKVFNVLISFKKIQCLPNRGNRSYSQQNQDILNSINSLNKYFVRLYKNTSTNTNIGIQMLYKCYQSSFTNLWFQKSAVILSTQTKINLQKSFWRLKANINSYGVKFNAVKLKKMYNNITKIYMLNIYIAFMMIDKYGQNYVNSHKSIEQTEKHHDNKISYNHECINNNIFQLIKSSSISKMARIFNINAAQSIKSWKYAAIPSTRIHKIAQQDYSFYLKIGAISCILKIHQHYLYKIKSQTFRNIKYHCITKQNDNNINYKLQILNQLTAMAQQVIRYKLENDNLMMEVQNKDLILRQVNTKIDILNLKVKCMNMHKFIDIVQRVYQQVYYKNMNDGFDQIIEQANNNIQQQCSMQN